MRWAGVRGDLLAQVLNPQLTLAEVERMVRKVCKDDLAEAERAVGALYGSAFKKAEAAYEARGCRGKQRWS